MKHIILVLLMASALHAETIFITVHGTWGADGSWHQPGSDFVIALEEGARTCEGRAVSFRWSGKNKHKHRLQAAKELEELIVSYPPETSINIISHSHGTNVAILASKRLAIREHNHHVINAIYGFATPVDADYYLPNMQMVKYFYHFFSLNDYIQTVLGFFNREYPALDRVANLRVTINGYQPSHNNMLIPTVARWLSDIHHTLGNTKQGNFPDFNFDKPGIVHFEAGACPRYTVDHKRKSLLEADLAKRTTLYQQLSQKLRSYVATIPLHFQNMQNKAQASLVDSPEKGA